MLELMHFPQEVLDASEIKAPAEKPISKTGMQMPRQLIESMTEHDFEMGTRALFR